MLEDSLHAYDDCIETIRNADYQFYQSAVASWFSFLSETPAFEREVLHLESLVDFQAWHDGLQMVAQGGGGVHFPAELDEALGLQLSLFHAIAKNVINAFQFAHAYVVRGPSPNSNLRNLTEQVFMPMSRQLRRRLESLLHEPDDGNLRDSDIALMDAVKTVFELLLTAGVKPAQIDKLLASSQQQYPAHLMPRAVAVMDMLREFVNDDSRSAHREQVGRILDEPAAGSG